MGPKFSFSARFGDNTLIQHFCKFLVHRMCLRSGIVVSLIAFFTLLVWKLYENVFKSISVYIWCSYTSVPPLMTWVCLRASFMCFAFFLLDMSWNGAGEAHCVFSFLRFSFIEAGSNFFSHRDWKGWNTFGGIIGFHRLCSCTPINFKWYWPCSWHSDTALSFSVTFERLSFSSNYLNSCNVRVLTVLE